MKTITLSAYAKINLFLDVIGRAPNGYHYVETILHAISLHDRVDVIAREAAAFSITIRCSDPSLPCDETNLAWRAAALFHQNHPLSDALYIHIEKNIPLAGGLAGGSTDAAAVLLALNRLYNTPFSLSSLCDMGAKLGADIPFCILANSGTPAAYGTHYGEQLTPMQPMPMCDILIVSAGESVSTPWAFAQLDAASHTSEKLQTVHHPVIDLPWHEDTLDILSSQMYNCFEAAILPQRPCAAQNISILQQNGAAAAQMSGSGPTVFGLFLSHAAATRTADILRANGAQVRQCVPLQKQK